MLKPPLFWKKFGLINFLLLPFSGIYFLFYFFYKKFSKEVKINVPVICVGNIYLGGTGKTPATVKLYNIFKKLNFSVATAKKNYKEQYDEQIILKNKTNLFVAESRIDILKKALKDNVELIIFDDGLQDRQIFYDIKIAR